MRRYTYWNRSPAWKNNYVGYEINGVAVGKAVFECDANNILEADEKLKAVTGIIAVACYDVWCSFEELK